MTHTSARREDIVRLASSCIGRKGYVRRVMEVSGQEERQEEG